MIITREQGQHYVSQYYAKWNRLLVLYATGFGKSRAALDAVWNRWQDTGEGLIVCHSEVARDDTWKEEVRQWQPGLMHMHQRVCYPSLKNIKGEHFQWVIMDEGHYLTPNSAVFFKQNKVDSLIVLTATEHDDPDKAELLRRIVNNHVIQITLDQAVQSGVLNPYKIRIWKVQMTPLEESGYFQACKRFMSAKNSGNEFFIQKMIGERARYIYELPTKVKAAMYLRDQIRAKGKRFVMFCGSVEQANLLSPFRYHSKSDKQHYNLFKEGKINELASIKQIQEGANIKLLESALVVQVNSRQYALVQKLGRLLRLPEGMEAIMHILVAADTFDEAWCRTATEPLDKTRISYHDLSRDLFDHYKLPTDV